MVNIIFPLSRLPLLWVEEASFFQNFGIHKHLEVFFPLSLLLIPSSYPMENYLL